MIVYVETNFIIELARRQNQHIGCEGVLSLAENRKIELVAPAFSIEESFGAWGRKRQVRNDLRSRLDKELAYLSQSEFYQDQGFEKFSDLDLFMQSAIDGERQRLTATLSRVLGIAVLIPMDQSILDEATVHQTDPLKLSPQDSIIYASVLSHLASVPTSELKCFLNKNRNDFDEPAIIEKLAKKGCELKTSFDVGLTYIKRELVKVARSLP